jgi:hypothetical protein
LITSSSLVSAIFARSRIVPKILQRGQRTYRCRRTRLFGVMCATQDACVRRRSWAGYTIDMFEFEFPTGTSHRQHTGRGGHTGRIATCGLGTNPRLLHRLYQGPEKHIQRVQARLHQHGVRAPERRAAVRATAIHRHYRQERLARVRAQMPARLPTVRPAVASAGKGHDNWPSALTRTFRKRLYGVHTRVGPVRRIAPCTGVKIDG